MAKLVDALDLGSSAERRGGSNPSTRTINSFTESDLNDLLGYQDDLARLPHEATPGVATDICDGLLPPMNASVHSNCIPSSFVLSFGS